MRRRTLRARQSNSKPPRPAAPHRSRHRLSAQRGFSWTGAQSITRREMPRRGNRRPLHPRRITEQELVPGVREDARLPHDVGHRRSVAVSPRFGAACFIVSPRRSRELCQRASPQEGGWRAEKRKPVVSASVAGCGERLSARHQALDERSDSAPNRRRSLSSLTDVPKNVEYKSRCLKARDLGAVEIGLVR